MGSYGLIIPALAAESASISVFDFRVALQPLTDPSLLKPEFRFLVDADRYEQAQASGGELPGGGHFAVRPLTARQLRFNHFWRDFVQRALLPAGETRPRWRLQVPFFARPRGPEPSIPPGELGGVPTSVHARAWLWPFGWATLVTVDTGRRMDLDALRDVVGRIRRSPVFALDDPAGRLTLSELFRALGQRMHEDLFASDAVSPTVALRRHWVVGMRSLPVPFTYGADVHPDRPPFSLSDRSRLHAVLRGEPVDRQMLDALEGRDRSGRRKFTLVPLEGSGFAITDFDYGTVAFLHEESQAGRARNAWHCLGANVRACSVAAEALRLGAAECEKEDPEAFPAIAELGKLAGASLRGLPRRYPTAFCSAFVKRGAA